MALAGLCFAKTYPATRFKWNARGGWMRRARAIGNRYVDAAVHETGLPRPRSSQYVGLRRAALQCL